MRAIILGVAFSVAALLPSAPIWAQSRDERIEPSSKAMAKLQALTPEEVAAGVEINDDDLDTVATLTTRSTFKNNGAFTDPVRSDNFFRAFIDKRTGLVRFQLYETITYNFVWRDFTSVSYASATGPQNVPVDVLDHKIGPCMTQGCVFIDTVVFDVPAEMMREIAGMYSPGASTLWRFKYRSRAGIDWEDRIAPAEAAGLLTAVSTYLTKRNISAE